ncbi:MAG: ABC transporter permease [Alphaproteobacteria bacterium]|nr:ABC transporter permease [Alphaproteobacteria bacterium]
MKYFPLIWAALRRKPVRTSLTFLSVTVAFTLFGLMIGLGATMDYVAKKAHPDRVWTMPRFDMNAMPVTIARQIAKLPGIKTTSVMSYLQGYVGDPKNRSGLLMADDEYGRIFSDWAPTPAQWDLVRHDRRAIIISRNVAAQYHKKVGDTFTLISETPRADGTKAWDFKIAAITPEMPEINGGYLIGNYDYYDKAMPLADQGKMNEVDLQVSDPAQAAAIGQRIEKLFANSGNPVQSTPEVVFAASGYGGVDINAITRKIALAGLGMILFLTASVIAKSVRERLPEFATLKTLGFSDAGLTALVIAEAALPCLAGAVCGVGIAGMLTQILPGILPPNFALPMPTFSVTVLAWAAASACAVALASTILPILRLSRLDIAAALSGRS